MSNDKTPHDRHANPAQQLIKRQEKFDPPLKVPEHGRSCALCKYMQKQRVDRISIATIMVCLRFPPHISITLTQTPRGPGQANATAFPHVNPSLWCWEFVAREEPESIGPGIAEG
jgi:hypothetical protein